MLTTGLIIVAIPTAWTLAILSMAVIDSQRGVA
jgi:hypothetical protein